MLESLAELQGGLIGCNGLADEFLQALKRLATLRDSRGLLQMGLLELAHLGASDGSLPLPLRWCACLARAGRAGTPTDGPAHNTHGKNLVSASSQMKCASVTSKSGGRRLSASNHLALKHVVEHIHTGYTLRAHRFT